MISFLPIAALAYALNAGSIIIDKILLQKSLPNPIAYVFYINILGLLAVVLIPFGFSLPSEDTIYFAVIAGIAFVGALYAMFTALKVSEASLVGPIVGSLNPLFSAIIGGIFLGEILSTQQYLAVGVLIIGSLILAVDFRNGSQILTKKMSWMVIAGLLFAISYVFLRQTFLQTSFLNGLIISRLAAGVLVAMFLLLPNLRQAIFQKQPNGVEGQKVNPKRIVVLLGLGQIMGAAQGLLITYAVSLANPALVNSLFGVQYVVILAVALLLYQNHPHLLEERLNKNVIIQKVVGVIILSFGLYLLSV